MRTLRHHFHTRSFLGTAVRAICGLFAATGVFAGLTVHPASADFISSELGTAANFALLETDGGNVSLANARSAGFITGNVGINGGNFSDSGVQINGNFIYGTAASGISSATGNVTGVIVQDQATLTAAANAAASASSTFAGLAPTLSNTSISGTTTINLAPGVNVADLTSVNLGHNDFLTLNGPTGSEIILNVTGGVKLNSGKIVLTGGLTANDVVFNITGTSPFATSGGLGNESVADGIFLALDAQIHLTPGAVTGEIISGRNINIAAGGSVVGVPAPLIGHGFPVLLAVGGLLLGAKLFERGKKQRLQLG